MMYKIQQKERQLSIYERALHFNPANEELLLDYFGKYLYYSINQKNAILLLLFLISWNLALGRELWTNEQLLEEWKKVMFTHAASPTMWQAYIGIYMPQYTVVDVNITQQLYFSWKISLSSVRYARKSFFNIYVSRVASAA